ncbi:CYFA0S04e03004g1_1 [Cyberlindnera fabianii]|uniref:Protein DOM34 homolog n=1 Tax=Cyberlindnera fabianii TaxID=36022 RepID=A0A061AR15_CYBFA|nr:CYFA0S04e03004g1_1 [Cyberlindnera fabianii]
MKLLSHQIESNNSGRVTLRPEDKEDLFTLYNILQKGDEIKITTTRNVKKGQGKSGAKGAASEKVIVRLTLRLEEIEFEPSDESMRLRGRTIEALDDVPLNSWHSAEVTYNSPFSLYKDEWDSRSKELIHKACDVDAKAEVAAVVLQEGVAHLCLITENMTVLKEKVEKSIPKKRRGDSSAYDKALEKFFKMVVESILKCFDLEKLKAIILASPGFYAKNLYDALFDYASRNATKEVFANKAKFLIAHSSTGFIQGLDEVLKSDQVQKQLADTKFAKDVMALEEFFKSLNADDSKAWYGDKEVGKAVDMGAVSKLLLTDTLFRADDVNIRKKYADLGDSVRANGGEVFVFSTMHESGVQLDQITGVAAVLKYPVYDLDESDEEESDDE